MGTLASELRPIAADLTPAPRVYVDANVPAGIVAAMRHELKWDVLFVLEDPLLRRAPDRDHFARARELARTLITLDHDFFDDRQFPPESSPGVIVCTAPDEIALLQILKHINREIFQPGNPIQSPLWGQKIEITSDVIRA